jgi:hypothetical protein
VLFGPDEIALKDEILYLALVLILIFLRKGFGPVLSVMGETRRERFLQGFHCFFRSFNALFSSRTVVSRNVR